jgi:hypothetical protein
MKTAMELVKTPILYIAQDDLALTHAVPTSGVAKTMMGCLVGRNPVRFVLLNKRPNGRAASLGKKETRQSPIQQFLGFTQPKNCCGSFVNSCAAFEDHAME